MAGTNKALGQHWLKNRAILDEIAWLASGEGDTSDFVGDENRIDKRSQGGSHTSFVLAVEIGPGLGFLTSSLLRRFDKVIAVEYDKELARKLPGSFPGKNLEVVSQDFLQYNLEAVPQPYVIAGNIPYYITSPIIEKILSVKNQPERAVLLIQKEVAERIISEKETLLSLMVKNRAEVVAGPVVKKEEFTPPPKVNSQVIVLTPRREPVVEEEVFDLIKRGFRNPRKKLVHNLVGLRPEVELKEMLTSIGVNAGARAGELKLSDWQKLYKMIQ